MLNYMSFKITYDVTNAYKNLHDIPSRMSTRGWPIFCTMSINRVIDRLKAIKFRTMEFDRLKIAEGVVLFKFTEMVSMLTLIGAFLNRVSFEDCIISLVI